MNIFENALEPLRRVHRKAKEHATPTPLFVVRRNITPANSADPQQFNHEPITYPGDPQKYDGTVGMLLIHGFTGSPHSMRPLADYFMRLGYPVEMPLLPGHATHWRDLSTTSYTDWVHCVEDAYQKLAQAGHRVVVVGISMGGCLAANLSARLPVAGTVLINPFFIDVNPMMRVAHRVARIVPTVSAIGSDIAIAGVAEGAYRRTPTAAVHQLHLLGVATRKLLPALRSPVLYLRSIDDHTITDASHQYFLRHAVAPVEFRWLTRSYHVATLDYDSERVKELTHEFVVSLDRAWKAKQ